MGKNRSNRIPTRDGWDAVNPDDADADWALQQFLGKSFEEAGAMFQSNALYYQEDLLSMPARPFNFYAPALANYLRSERAHGDADGASSFLQMLRWMLENQPQIVDDARDVLLAAAEHIAKNQSFYEADEEIYGSFSEHLKEIHRYA